MIFWQTFDVIIDVSVFDVVKGHSFIAYRNAYWADLCLWLFGGALTTAIQNNTKKVPILDLSSTCVLCKTKQSISVKIGNGQYAVFRARYLEKKSNYVRR